MKLISKIRNTFSPPDEDEELRQTKMLLHRNKIMRMEASNERKEELGELYKVLGKNEYVEKIESDLVYREEVLRREEDFMDNLGIDI
jgi:hypothetical protein